MKQLILPLALYVICCGCGAGSKSTQSILSSPSNTQAPAATALSVTTTALPTAVKNVGYSATLTAQGGTAPYAWKVISGQMPAGITLSSAGKLSGTSSATGDFNITVQVSDSAASPATAQVRTHVKKVGN